MPLTELEFGGHAAVRLEAGDVSVVATTSVGPRILGLLGPDGANAFAETPDATLECPGSDRFHLYGGHRLWASPEDPRVTYRPDDAPVEVAETAAGGIRLTTGTDAVARTSRSLTISALGDRRFEVHHAVTNEADDSQELGPWAITMLPSGGRAWLPLLEGAYDPGGFQANRSIVLWPYARLDDPRLLLSDTLIEVRSDTPERLVDAPVKVGTALRRGWIAHWRDGVLFVKRARHREDARHPDLGASGQVYWNGPSGELETLGPLVTLAPGETVEHVETWEVRFVDEAEAERLVTSGALDEGSR